MKKYLTPKTSQRILVIGIIFMVAAPVLGIIALFSSYNEVAHCTHNCSINSQLIIGESLKYVVFIGGALVGVSQIFKADK